jgi:hypothetical protein
MSKQIVSRWMGARVLLCCCAPSHVLSGWQAGRQAGCYSHAAACWVFAGHANTSALLAAKQHQPIQHHYRYSCPCY